MAHYTDETTVRTRLQEMEQYAQREARLFEAFGDYVDPRGSLNDDGEQWVNLGGIGPSGPAAFLRDIDTLPYNTETELAITRRTCRFAATRTEIGVGITDKLADYVIGEGIKYTAASEQKRPADPALVEAVQAVIDEFTDHNNWAQLDRELFQREVRDGEWFVALYPDNCGKVSARCIEPEQVLEPHDPNRAESMNYDHEGFVADEALDWSYGVVTSAHDVEKAHGYWVQFDVSSGRYLPASRVEHRKANVNRNLKRGVSDFYPGRRTVWQASRVLNNTAEGVCIQAALAGVREHQDTTSNDQIQALQRGRLDAQTNFTTVGGYSKNQSIEKMQPGTIMDMRGYKYVPGPLASQASEWFLGSMAACCRIAGTRWSMPEYLVSSDASNGNFASSLVAGDPFVKHCERRQREHGQSVRSLLWKVLRLAHAAGRLPALGFGEVERTIEITAEGPTVQIKDQAVETARNKTLSDEGLLARKNWASREGLNLEDEIQAGAQVKPVAPNPFGMLGEKPQPMKPLAESMHDASSRARALAAELWAGYGAGQTLFEVSK